MVALELGTPAEGRDWLLKAVDSGDVRAMGLLGDEAIDGLVPGMSATEGMNLLRRAAEGGDPIQWGGLATDLSVAMWGTPIRMRVRSGC